MLSIKTIYTETNKTFSENYAFYLQTFFYDLDLLLSNSQFFYCYNSQKTQQYSIIVYSTYSLFSKLHKRMVCIYR